MSRISSVARLRHLLAAVLVAAVGAAFAACGDDPEPVAEVERVNGLTTSVALDPGFVKSLNKLKLKPGPVGIGEIKGGKAVFPITDGEVTYYDPAEDKRPYVEGELVHDGSGLSLTAGKTEVKLTDFVIDPGESTLNGKVIVDDEEAESDAQLFDLDGSTLKPLKTNKKKGTATLKGTTVELSSDAAELLNDTFETDALEGGLKIGVSTITINLG